VFILHVHTYFPSVIIITCNVNLLNNCDINMLHGLYMELFCQFFVFHLRSNIYFTANHMICLEIKIVHFTISFCLFVPKWFALYV